jgi:FkbM family methyltransferase
MTDFSICRSELRALAQNGSHDLKRPLWIYGAGGFGRALAREMRRLGMSVRGFIDRRAHDLPMVDGLPCHAPDDIADHDVEGTGFVNGIMNHATDSADAVRWAARSGFADLVFPAQLLAVSGFAVDSYWLARPQVILDHLHAIEEFHDGLDDEESRAILSALLAYRMTTDPRHHPPVDRSGAYLPSFLPIWDRAITFVDAGAYTGDTLEALLGAGITIEDWIAFEPDPANMHALRATAARQREGLASYTLFTAGLSDRAEMVSFASGSGAASRVLEGAVPEGSLTAIQTLSLDDTLRRNGQVYVKMDIEGSERRALVGMRECLKSQPALAISIYHRPDDLWEIPRLVRQLYDRPRLRLRQHGFHAFDTVLYVTPG